MNKTLSLVALTALLAAACSKKEAAPPAAETPPPVAAAASASAATPAAAPLPAEAQAIQTYVDDIEAKKDSFTKKEIALTPELLKDSTDAAWEKMHAYSDQGALKRIKLYPKAPATKVEEFYFRDGQLAYVSDEPDGTDASRDQLFFAGGQVVAVIKAKGGSQSLTDADRERGAQLSREATDFYKIASSAK